MSIFFIIFPFLLSSPPLAWSPLGHLILISRLNLYRTCIVSLLSQPFQVSRQLFQVLSQLFRFTLWLVARFLRDSALHTVSCSFVHRMSYLSCYPSVYIPSSLPLYLSLYPFWEWRYWRYRRYALFFPVHFVLIVHLSISFFRVAMSLCRYLIFCRDGLTVCPFRPECLYLQGL